MPCNPDEINELAKLLADGKFGETTAEPLFSGDPTPSSGSVATMRAKTGFIGGKLRVARHAWGDEFGVNVIDPILREGVRTENIANRYRKEVLDAVRPVTGEGFFTKLKHSFMGIPEDKSIRLREIVSKMDSSGKYLGPEGTATAEEIQAASTIRKWFTARGREFGVDADTFLNDYMPLLQQHPQGILRDPLIGTPAVDRFIQKMQEEGSHGFYAELERKGILTTPGPTLQDAVETFLRGGIRHKYTKPLLDRVESEFVNPYFEVKFITTPSGQKQLVAGGENADASGYQLWQEFKHTLLGGPTPMDMGLTNSFKRLIGLFSKDAAEKFDVRSLYQISNAGSTAYYGGAIGGPIGARPSTLIRQLTQLVPIYAELGGKYTSGAIRDSFDRNLIARYETNGLISSPFESLLNQAENMTKAGRVISGTTTTALKLFSAMDQWLRTITVRGSELKFDDYMARGILNKLPMKKELRPVVDKLVEQGKIDEAKIRYAFENVATLQYIYSRSARPAAFKGALGNVLNMFMTFPLNTGEMFATFGKRAVEGDPAPLLRLLFTTGAIMGAGSELLNADMYSWTLAQAAMPYSMTMPKLGIDIYKAGTSEVDHLAGTLFNTGETSYEKYQRIQGWKNVAQDLTAFVPGGLFFFQDIPKVMDERTLAWALMGLKPKADVIEEIAREKRAERARETRQESGLSTLRGIQP